MPIWHVSGTDFSEASNVSSVMEKILTNANVISRASPVN